MKAKNWNLHKALAYVKNKRTCIKPNENFLKQLEVYQGILSARLVSCSRCQVPLSLTHTLPVSVAQQATPQHPLEVEI